MDIEKVLKYFEEMNGKRASANSNPSPSPEQRQ
mgnify:CR=1 FL=1